MCVPQAKMSARRAGRFAIAAFRTGLRRDVNRLVIVLAIKPWTRSPGPGAAPRAGAAPNADM